MNYEEFNKMKMTSPLKVYKKSIAALNLLSENTPRAIKTTCLTTLHILLEQYYENEKQEIESELYESKYHSPNNEELP